MAEKTFKFSRKEVELHEELGRKYLYWENRIDLSKPYTEDRTDDGGIIITQNDD